MANKFTPSIKKYILSKRKEDPTLSIRKLSSLVEKEMGARIGKSSISNFLKSSSFSNPVGRPSAYTGLKKKEIGAAGSLLFLGLLPILHIETLLEAKSPHEELERFLQVNILKELSNRLGIKDYSAETFEKSLHGDDGLKVFSLHFTSAYLERLEEIKAIRLSFSDSTELFIDPQFRTIWSRFNVPEVFCLPRTSLEYRIKSFASKRLPWIFMTASGFDFLSKAFFSFLQNIESSSPTLEFINYDRKIVERYKVKEMSNKVIFGLKPEQFKKGLSIKNLSKEMSIKLSYNRVLKAKESKAVFKQSSTSSGIELNTILVYNKKGALEWAIVTNIDDSERALKLYYEQYSQPNAFYRDHMSVLEKFSYSSPRKSFFDEKTQENPYLFFLEYLHKMASRYLFLGHEKETLEWFWKNLYSLPGRKLTAKKTIKISYPDLKHKSFIDSVLLRYNNLINPFLGKENVFKIS